VAQITGRILNGWTIGLALLMSLPGGSLAFSQEPATRAEADRRRREEKDQHLEPYKPGRVERAMRLVEEKQVFLSGREGVYPKLGSLTTGSGFAYGAGYRDSDLFKNYGTLDVWAATSLRRYWATEARLTFPKLARKRLHVEAWAAHRDYPQEDFFGLGPDSNRDDETSYAIQTNYVGGRIGVRPAPLVMVGGGVEYMTPKLGMGKDDRVPSIEQLFNPSTAPGLDRSVNYLHSDAFFEIDYRQPKNPRKGGFYRVDLSRFDDQTSGQYTFFRVDTDLRQYVGFLEGRRVVSARLFVSTSDAGSAQTIPFYLMPTLGGNDTLRGFREYRFRGPQALLAQGEYRWEIWSGLEGALFYDAGKVATVRSDLNFQDLETDYGFGFRFNTDSAVVFRVDAGFGSRDGKHLYMVFGGVF
jgi:outer membrane protein assembly factor BamA